MFQKEGKIIIAYDEDESHYESSATTMVQRGIDNLFVLSGGTAALSLLRFAFRQSRVDGQPHSPPTSLISSRPIFAPGLRVMAEKFPQGVIVGELPASCRPPKARKGPGAPAVPQMGELTASNLDIVREQLETNLLNDDGAFLLLRCSRGLLSSLLVARHSLVCAHPSSSDSVVHSQLVPRYIAGGAEHGRQPNDNQRAEPRSQPWCSQHHIDNAVALSRARQQQTACLFFFSDSVCCAASGFFYFSLRLLQARRRVHVVYMGASAWAREGNGKRGQ